jgi:CRP/FNR family transcriptional regulator
VSEVDVSRFASLFRPMSYSKRAMIFDYGDHPATIFLLKKGVVRLSRITADGKEVTLALLSSGDIFGEELLIGKRTRTTIARCVEDSLLCTVRAEELLQIAATHPFVALNVAKSIGARLDVAHDAVEDIASLRVGDRILRLIERLANDHGRSTSRGVLLDVRLTHADIASLIGSSRETVTLELRKLASSGAIRIDEHRITLL